MAHGGRHMFWVDSLLSNQVANNTNALVSLMTGISSSESRMGMTLIRLIFCFDFGHLIHDSGEGSQIVDFGIGIASQEAFAAGVVADPEVSTEFPTGGWLFRCRLRTYGFAADQPSVYSRTIERDLRAKRKLNNGELFFSVDNSADQGTGGSIQALGIVRALFLST